MMTALSVFHWWQVENIGAW